jgi:putative flippase GtrA
VSRPLPTLRRDAWRFACVGLANTLFCAGLMVLARTWLGWPHLLANGAGYAVGIGMGYWFHSRWTFASADASMPSNAPRMLRYLAVVLAAWALNAIVVESLLALGTPSAWSHIGGFPVYTVSQFFGLRLWAMKRTVP